LKDGVDYTGSINRMRFDMVVNAAYLAVTSAVRALLADAAVDSHKDEIVYMGGTMCVYGLDDYICLSGGFRGKSKPFSRGTFVGGGIGDPITILARGLALQAALISPNEMCFNLNTSSHVRQTWANPLRRF
jgi:hypothetical protein